MSGGDLRKLPKWAQNMIAEQGREIERLEDVISKQSGPAETPIQVEDGLGVVMMNVPEDGVIRIRWDEGRKFDLRIRGDHLELVAEQSLNVRPVCANRIMVRPEPLF